MYKRALEERDKRISKVTNWEGFMGELNKKNLCLVPWCNNRSCEENIKEKSKRESEQRMKEGGEEEEQMTGSAKSLCIPEKQDPLEEGSKCFACG